MSCSLQGDIKSQVRALGQRKHLSRATGSTAGAHGTRQGGLGAVAGPECFPQGEGCGSSWFGMEGGSPPEKIQNHQRQGCQPVVPQDSPFVLPPRTKTEARVPHMA